MKQLIKQYFESVITRIGYTDAGVLYIALAIIYLADTLAEKNHDV